MVILQPRFVTTVLLASVAWLSFCGGPTTCQEVNAPAPRAGVLRDANFFPLAVWLQSPTNAERYKAAGINVFVALWRGPTDEQLATLRQHGLYAICGQNSRALTHLDDPTILAWMHNDEPDNAQSIPGGKGYGPPILPEKIVADYARMKAADPTRPILLNLGQGVAWDQYIGRGVRRNHPEDYPEYVKGCDIASFDIYPGCHDHPAVAGKLWFVADGVSRLRQWAGPARNVWNCIECTRISNENAKATPAQVRAEVWMSLVRGSRGIIYFCHQFKPTFIEAGLLADAAMLAEVTAINRQIQELAPVLNSPTVEGKLSIATASESAPVEAMVKEHGGKSYVFAVGMRDGAATATFEWSGAPLSGTVEVLGEGRTIAVQDGRFRDEFMPFGVHLYCLNPR